MIREYARTNSNIGLMASSPNPRGNLAASMPTPQRSTAVHTNFQQWVQGAPAVMQLVQTVVSLYLVSILVTTL